MKPILVASLKPGRKGATTITMYPEPWGQRRRSAHRRGRDSEGPVRLRRWETSWSVCPQFCILGRISVYPNHSPDGYRNISRETVEGGIVPTTVVMFSELSRVKNWARITFLTWLLSQAAAESCNRQLEWPNGSRY